jgi:hypothetical protein
MSHMGNVIKDNRKVDLFYSNGVEGDPQPYPSNIDEIREDILKNLSEDLNHMYNNDLYFEGIFNDLNLSLSPKRATTKQIFRIEGGGILTPDQ